MAERILTFTAIAVGTALIVYATIGRLLRFHRPLGWISGGEISVTGELCCGIFVLSGGLALLHSPAWIILCLASWLAGFISQRRASRRYAAAENRVRTINSVEYPGVFDNAPPTDIDAARDDMCDLYDAGTCIFLGKASKRDLKLVVNRLRDMPEQGPNDLYLIQETLGMFSNDELTDEFVALLNRALENRDYLVLRWIPTSSGKLGP